jgi:hypothetical protein
MSQGQKIIIHEYGTEKQLCPPVHGFALPRPGDLYTIFDEKTGTYTHCEVINVSHGSSTKTNSMISVLHVKVLDSLSMENKPN